MTDPLKGYDEFSMLADNAEEAGIVWHGTPTVVRKAVEVGPGQRVSGLVWGDGPARLVLLHGGGQNAHTWDTVALALGEPLVAIDLPGHGHSDWPSKGAALDPRAVAADVAVSVARWAPEAQAVVGMSLGGLTALALVDMYPDLVRRLVLVDITPGVDSDKSSDIVAFLAGPESFATFDEILERTKRFNPTRSESSLRRGILHNAVPRPDGSWIWRHQLGRPAGGAGVHVGSLDFSRFWDMVDHLSVPTLLVRGGRSPVVDHGDLAEFRRRCPVVEVAVVEGAGHSIQGDQPVELAELIRRFALLS